MLVQFFFTYIATANPFSHSWSVIHYECFYKNTSYYFYVTALFLLFYPFLYFICLKTSMSSIIVKCDLLHFCISHAVQCLWYEVITLQRLIYLQRLPLLSIIFKERFPMMNLNKMWALLWRESSQEVKKLGRSRDAVRFARRPSNNQNECVGEIESHFLFHPDWKEHQFDGAEDAAAFAPIESAMSGRALFLLLLVTVPSQEFDLIKVVFLLISWNKFARE